MQRHIAARINRNAPVWFHLLKHHHFQPLTAPARAAQAYRPNFFVAPYNLQVNLLKQLLPEGAQIGTVDKFQGQEAAVVIVSMTTSKGVEAPRGTEFLFNPNRFNVAISRAQCLALVVHGAELLDGAWTKIDDLRRLNLFAHAEAVALRQP
jgi:AAA domain